ncbi:MAG: excinuclease ABC subunit UvrA [Pseudomonadota bacterium]|nr:excinuclease ABC subunit UvrA [Pseudomonadota bacterium]
MEKDDQISVRGAKEHNLKNIDVDIPRNKLVVITGPSGSGKSSLAFDTIYAEGQRRYVESLSSYARQFLNIQDKPDVESIDGLSPAIAIDQKTTSRNPRSTVGTVTEIYDYLRLLYARIGIPYSPATGQPIESQTISQMVDRILSLPEGTKLYLMAPIVRGHKGEYKKEIAALQKKGFQRLKIDGELYEIDEIPALDKNKKHEIDVVVDRIAVSKDLGNRLPDSIEQALELGNGLLKVQLVSGDRSQVTDKKASSDTRHLTPDTFLLSSKFACPVSGFTLPEIEPRLFSFNSPYGACPECDGLGTEAAFDPDLVVPDRSKSLSERAIAPWGGMPWAGNTRFFQDALASLARHYKFSTNTPFKDLPDKIQNIILYGSGTEDVRMTYYDGSRSFAVEKPFEGVIPNLERRYKEITSDSVREEFDKYKNAHKCEACHGYRLKPEALCVKVAGLHIGQVTEFTIEAAHDWFGRLESQLSKKHQEIAHKILKEIRERLQFLVNVGLDYLTLARESGTLSGGESQRIRLASQIGSGLSGVLYVLDEPSIGLHQCDNERLLHTLKHLRDLGNTVIVVEHDEDTMRAADHLIDIGPGAGIHGGKVVAEGTATQVMKNKASLTGQYLSGAKFIAVPDKRRPVQKKKIAISGASANNLKNVKADIPLGTFCCVTGVSGGGKSTLVIETLYKAINRKLHGSRELPGHYDSIAGLEYIDKVIEIDQSPIGRTPRSNPATYTGAFTPIRDWYTALPEAKARGYHPGRFSFNVKGGRCEACQGDGLIKIEMHFLPDVYVKCDVCHGRRYNRETLEIKYKDKSIADVLDMTVEEGAQFFSAQPSIREKLLAMQEVGLGYIAIGQSATTLSGGEAQRIKLARELSKRATGRTLYILDEPTTGLHSDDIKKLLVVLHKLVDSGNTVLVIEHNLDVIKTADWIIDIGPGGGDKGGKIIATGTPEAVAGHKDSITGKYLLPLLKRKKAA